MNGPDTEGPAGSSRPEATRALLLVGCSLLALAWVHGMRLDDDSYAHYATSVQTVVAGDWRSLITDTWNKPLTTLAYGVAGWAGGLGWARTVGVAVVLLSALLLRRVLELWLGWRSTEHVWFVPAFFLLQIGLLPQAFLTMTEQLAGALLAGALYAWVRQRPWLAFLTAGFMPWARIESLFVVAPLFLVMSFGLLRGDWRRQGLRVVAMNGLGALPFVLWWAGGFALKGDVFWMSSSYVYLREPFWRHIGSTNAVTGLCGALSTPQLLLVVIGLLAARAAPRQVLSLFMLVAPLAGHLAFTSLVAVYPRDSGFGGWAIAALNARSYNTVAPLFCLLAGWGCEYIFGAGTAPDDRRRAVLVSGTTLTGLLCLGFYAFQGTFPLFGPVARVGGLVLGGGFLVLAAAVAWRGPRARWRRLAGPYAWIAMASAPVMVPFFWHPLRWQDSRAEVQRAFLRELAGAPKQPPLVVQSMSGRLDFFSGGAAVPLVWNYPALVGTGAVRAPAGTWIVLDTDERGRPVGYPQKVLDTLLDTNAYARAATFVDTRPKAAWERGVDRLTPRNRGGGWIVLEKLP